MIIIIIYIYILILTSSSFLSQSLTVLSSPTVTKFWENGTQAIPLTNPLWAWADQTVFLDDKFHNLNSIIYVILYHNIVVIIFVLF